MKENKLAKRLFKMKIGESVNIQKKNNYEGTFIRVPSGWIYRYVGRHGSTSCFIPYTEDIMFWDIDLNLKPCPYCKSTHVLIYVYHDTKYKQVKCETCKASGPKTEEEIDAVRRWNNMC